MADDCVICRIVAGALRARVLHDDDLVMAIDVPHDHPVRQAPVHFLVVPKEHVASARELERRHEPALGRMLTVAGHLARAAGIEASGYRLVSNTGDDAGQTVFHLHLHCLGGRRLGPEG
jgi:histidine triad (HIT) family protein